MIHEPCVILKPESVQVDETARIDSFCKLEGGEGLRVGAMVHVASFCHLNAGGGKTELRDHCGLATGVKILSGQPDLAYAAICPQEPEGVHGVIRMRTTIGSYALVCANAVVLPGVMVGEGAVVAAGAVVTKDVPPWSVVAGIPARVVGTREVTKGSQASPFFEGYLDHLDWVGI